MLDVATGTGAIARALVRRYGCRVVGVDQSPQMLEGARERIAKAGLADRIELQLGSAETLDLRGGLVRRAHHRLSPALPRRPAGDDDGSCCG